LSRGLPRYARNEHETVIENVDCHAALAMTGGRFAPCNDGGATLLTAKRKD